MDSYYREVMDRFANQYEKLHSSIIQAARSGNFDQVRSYAEQLKGLDAAVDVAEKLAKERELV